MTQDEITLQAVELQAVNLWKLGNDGVLDWSEVCTRIMYMEDVLFYMSLGRFNDEIGKQCNTAKDEFNFLWWLANARQKLDNGGGK